MTLPPQTRKGGLELHVAAEGHARRPHQRIDQIVADTGQGPVGDQVATADLHPVTAHVRIVCMVRREAHGIPAFEGRPGNPVTSRHVVFVGVLIKEVEFDQFDALEFKVEQRTIDAPAVGQKVLADGGNGLTPIMQTAGIAGGVVILPVDPRHIQMGHGVLTSAAACGVFAHPSPKIVWIGRRERPAGRVWRCQYRLRFRFRLQKPPNPQ